MQAATRYAVREDNTLEVDFNPHLTPWEKPSPNNVAGKGAIEEPGRAPNLIWQNRAAPPSAYEDALADALEKVFDGGAVELEDVVRALNETGMRMPDGRSWTPSLFETEMARLGA